MRWPPSTLHLVIINKIDIYRFLGDDGWYYQITK